MSVPKITIPACKHFTGYRPCVNYKNCLKDGCQFEDKMHRTGTRILIISMRSQGNILRNTSLLRTIKKEYPISTVYWIVHESYSKILHNNTLVDEIIFWNDEQRMVMRNIEFDVLYNTEKTPEACAFANEINAKQKYGFLINSDGKVIPANEGAIYYYNIGIDDELRYKKNKKTMQEMLHETLGLSYFKNEYIFNFTVEEIDFIENYKKQNHFDENKFYAGFNTGSSRQFPNKKMSVEQHVMMIEELIKFDRLKIVLTGGKEDTERNLQIYNLLNKETQKQVLYTPTNLGIRNGACFMSLCDVIITGESYGMHLAIALKKMVIVWFGVSPPQELELYGRGDKLIPYGLDCHPCMMKACPYNLECIDLIDLKRITDLVKKYSLLKPYVNINN
ncbi:glycosyltransferase family 9 protein [soil metagenome]